MEINKIEYKIGVYDLEGHFIDSSDSWEYLEKEFDLQKSDIKNYIHRNSNFTGIYQLKIIIKNHSRGLPNTIGNVDSRNSGMHKRPVAKYYNDKLISVYPDMNKAGDLTGISPGNIASSCIKGHKAGAFTFKYIE